jgi:hypothetical protein
MYDKQKNDEARLQKNDLTIFNRNFEEAKARKKDDAR